MGQLMGIVGPLLLLGGAVFVFSKRCELLGMCGDDKKGNGSAEGEDLPQTPTPIPTPTTPTPTPTTPQQPQQQPQQQQQQQQPTTTLTPQQLQQLMQQLQQPTPPLPQPQPQAQLRQQQQQIPLPQPQPIAGLPSSCCICRTESNGDVRCQRHGQGNWTRYESAKKDMAGALRICSNGCGTRSNYTRSYFVDPNYIRPFTLYHRIGNLR